MGTWGTGISSNDTFADIYSQFIDLYNKGLSVSDITKKLIAKNQETINIPDDAANFWFAIAKGQWECKELSSEVFSKVEQIIVSGENLKVWKELGASPQNLKDRDSALLKFLSELKTERDKPRKRTKKNFLNSVFKKGDCLVYKMENGNYGGAFVLTDEQETEVGNNYIAITMIDKQDKPTIEDFKKAEVYQRRVNEISFKGTEIHRNWLDQPQIGEFSTLLYKTHGFEIEVIGQLPIYNEYIIRKDKQVGFVWTVLKSFIPYRAEYIKKNGEVKSKLMLSKWTKKHWL